ncbi:hypothetical protein JCM10908_003187 [Rhodotorula pacifica]|uniref:uncharacterized protein n=1 Tax=Rhodotorula pacifica TaxID=1495444 RepID=UPI003177F754
MTTSDGYITFGAGDKQAYDDDVRRYDTLVSWLEANGPKYGLPGRLSDLDEAGQETLTAVYSGDSQVDLKPDDLRPPPSLLLPRLRYSVSTSPGLKKTTANFLALLTDEKKLVSKRAPNPPLRYAGTPVFRIEKGFVAQTGDVTRKDGSGGESIYGGAFNDEKEGLKVQFQKGTLAMANSGKNSNTSQFFVTLTDDPTKLKKLTGKYVAFGQVDLSDPDSLACLERLDSLGDGKGGTTEPVWIEHCGLVS